MTFDSRSKPPKPSLTERVRTAATRTLQHDGAVGPIDLLVAMRLIESVHFEQWKRSSERYRVLENHIQCGPQKLEKVFRIFQQWASESKLDSIVVPYQAAVRSGQRKLQLLANDDPARETFLLTRYRSADQSSAKKKQIEKKLAKVADLIVYVMTADDCRCSECDVAIRSGEWMYREDDQPLCMTCADFDYLEFLPSGNATLTRRAKKFSPLSAVVMKFNRRHKRYHRMGLLVTSDAIEQAEASMDLDADQRERQRLRAAIARDRQDEKLVIAMIDEIKRQFPSCPDESAERIAQHTALRGSGRVGRSAAGRDVDPQAIRLAVIAHIRHEHTDYDDQLMKGVPRSEARRRIQFDVDDKRSQWQAGA